MTTSVHDHLGMIKAQCRRWERACLDYDAGKLSLLRLEDIGAELRRREDALDKADNAAGRPSSAFRQPTIAARMRARVQWAKMMRKEVR